MIKTITSVTLTRDVSLITVNDLPADGALLPRLFLAISEAGINIDMISQTPPRGGTVRVSFTIGDDCLPDALRVIGSFKAEYPQICTEVSSSGGKLSFYGDAMKNTPGVAAEVITLIKNACGEIMIITTSTQDISLLVRGDLLPNALDAINKAAGIALK